MQDASAHSNPREVMLQDPPAVVLGGSLSGREGIGAAQVGEGRSEAQMLFNCGFPLSLVAQTVRHLPAMRETWVRSLGREDLLEKEMATHSSTLAWRIPWIEEPVGYSLWGCKESDTTERLHFHRKINHT